jgi:hypothetical protein
MPSRQVIILPPTGGANFADRSLFDALCARGHQVTLLDYEQKSGISLDFGIHDRLSKEVLAVIDNQLANTQLPATLVGASLGGLYASMAFSYSRTQQKEFLHLKWIDKIVITVAGGPLADVLTFSEAEQVRQQRELRLNRLGIKSLQEYKSALEKNIFYDPLVWAQPMLRTRVLMFNSSNDAVVPSKTQESLWEAWGKPEAEWLTLGHEYSVGYVYLFYLDQMDRFLKKP